MKRKTRIKLPQLPKFTETRLVNTAFAIAPWLTPVITAWLVYNATMAKLGWSMPQALISAAIIETNGISSTNLLLYLYRNKAERPLLVIAAGIVSIYAGVVLALTIVLDTYPQAANYAPILFVFLVLSSNATVAVRAHHKTVLAEKRKAKKTGTQPAIPVSEPVTPTQKPGVTAKVALRELFATDPDTRMWSSEKLARRIGCTGANVRKVAQRNGDGGWVV